MASDATQIGVRVPNALLARIDDLAARLGGTRTDAVLLLLVGGFALDDARRSWRDEGDAVQAVRDFFPEGEGEREPLTPESATGQWRFEGVWSWDEDGERRLVLEPHLPVWWGLLAQPPAVSGDEDGGR